ncbi:4-diphosphocytidyl-2-C-methyl-D-erythritol kinase [Chlamydiales bacterium STE3]|nr:4-diphosphocytidyl-2-C-methyl-D-erythritol kinase [Chlamydiales bacterium STE3]
MLIFRSPAKVNLFLSVLSKRSDGYHELASLFQAIDLFDALHFEFDLEDRFSCSDSSLPTDGSNLVIRALHLFRKKTNLNFPVKIHLEKKIPSEAGLGGGSSNAATTLFALNEMAHRPATILQLQSWSAEIGSDISFFFSEGTAYCTGRGEIVHNLEPIHLPQMTIVKPQIGLATPKVFRYLNLKNLPQRNLGISLEGFYSANPHFFNDLEAAALLAEPKLSLFKSALIESGFSDVHLTGSGTAFFCFGKGKPPPDTFSVSARSIRRVSNHWY